MDYTTHFPFLKNGIYLNTASIGLLSEEVMTTKKNIDQRYYEDVFQLNLEEDEIIDQIRADVANYLGAKKELTALIPSFSYGMNAIAEALPTASKVLLLSLDYPSVNLPIENRDFKICYASIDENLEQNIRKALQAHSIDYFIFSEVQFLNGVALTEAFLNELKLNFPNLKLICDATQSAGTRFFDFENSPFDAYGASAYKWFHAGWGNGFFLFKDQFIDQIEPKSAGSNSKLYKPDGPMRKVGFLEPGHWNLNPFLSLQTALKLHFETIGIQAIQYQIQEVSRYAFEEFKKRGILEKNVALRKVHTHIFNLQLPDQFLDICVKNNIYCAKRRSGIRVSFHYFNRLSEVDELLQLIDKFH